MPDCKRFLWESITKLDSILWSVDSIRGSGKVEEDEAIALLFFPWFFSDLNRILRYASTNRADEYSTEEVYERKTTIVPNDDYAEAIPNSIFQRRIVPTKR